jgi:hypothetical protein
MSVNFTINFSFEDGWWTSQIVEEPAAIGQGRTKEDAKLNVLAALHDLYEARRLRATVTAERELITLSG